MKKLLILLPALLLFSCGNTQKTGYIDVKKVFNDFEYKKELEKELTSITNNRKFVLDSMETNLRLLSKKVELDKNNKDLVAEFQTLRSIYLEKRSMIEDENRNIVQQFDEKIIKQLNSYVKSYGQQNNYSMIYGATSDGNIMYGDTTLDISREVTEYINKKYKGK
ncbi:MAG: outer rane chaperone Skp (OmpH) [Bacteroidetes bacterium]|jgi:outer membrane protein|nr:outer rane chaperone Skp (OmpH) [Bacteroidota bacterium]